MSDRETRIKGDAEIRKISPSLRHRVSMSDYHYVEDSCRETGRKERG
jgi:hypothetical protein